MDKDQAYILTINGGSSSIRFALYHAKTLMSLLHGKIDRIGQKDPELTYIEENGNQHDTFKIKASDNNPVGGFLIDWLEKKIKFSLISGVGHRVVFGMKHTKPARITQKLLNELHRASSYDMDHLPAEIELIEELRKRYPNLPQFACFDTEFHLTMPRVARILPIPRRFDVKGVQRYGFHGLSYAYLMEELARIAGRKSAHGRVILAHLGNGASLAAVRKGKSIDTSMGFTPASGLPMGTRPGDLDPGVAWYMMKSENMSPKEFNNLINHNSGLLGISETSSDMRDLLAKEADDVRAAEAVALFCYQVKKWIGAFTAALGGLDTLVFAGGIGENCPVIRSRICEGLEFLGIDLEARRNLENGPIISKDMSQTVVRVIHTEEEWMIAKICCLMLNFLKK